MQFALATPGSAHRRSVITAVDSRAPATTKRLRTTHRHTTDRARNGRRTSAEVVVRSSRRRPQNYSSVAVTIGSGGAHDCRKIAGRLIISSVSIRDGTERDGWTADRQAGRVCACV